MPKSPKPAIKMQSLVYEDGVTDPEQFSDDLNAALAAVFDGENLPNTRAVDRHADGILAMVVSSRTITPHAAQAFYEQDAQGPTE